MNIVCMALTGAHSNCSTKDCGGLPLQLVAIIADLIGAGHRVRWFEQPLCQSGMDKAHCRLACINPDVMLFACDGTPLSPMMASVAVRCGSVKNSEYITEGVMRPAGYWSDLLTNPAMNLRSLRQKTERLHAERKIYIAMNDANIEGVATPV